MRNGIEIFFQNLGDADSIFVRTWENDVPTNILIDGGYAKDYPQVKKFLIERLDETKSRQIDHLVCSHCHDDHAAGLVALAEEGFFPIKQAWVHDTRTNSRILTFERIIELRMHAQHVYEKVSKSERTRHDLIAALEKNYPNTPILEPFFGARIGPLIVLGPTPEFFNAQYNKLDDAACMQILESRYESQESQVMFETKAAADAKPLGDTVSPENEVATVIAYPKQVNGSEQIYLLTSDAGCEAFRDILTRFPTQLEGLQWMQGPHHGSRRNLDEALIDHFRPKTTMISAAGVQKGGVVKHPRIKMVNKLKEYGKVYSTHYSTSEKGWLRQTAGTVFEMKTVPATPLYDKS